MIFIQLKYRMNPMDGNMQMDEGMFPMDFSGGPGGMPMNMFPPDMPGGPMGMPFFNPNMPGVPMGFDGGDFRGNNNPGRPPMRGGGHMSSRSQIPRSSHSSSHGGSGSHSGGHSSSSHGGSGGHSSSHGGSGSGGGSGSQSSSWRGRDDSSEHRSDS